MQCAADNHLIDWCAAEKLELLRHLCTELGVYTAPCCIEDVWLVPLYSWYHASFDAEPDIHGALPAHQVSLRRMPLSSPRSGCKQYVYIHQARNHSKPCPSAMCVVVHCP